MHGLYNAHKERGFQSEGRTSTVCVLALHTLAMARLAAALALMASTAAAGIPLPPFLAAMAAFLPDHIRQKQASFLHWSVNSGVVCESCQPALSLNPTWLLQRLGSLLGPGIRRLLILLGVLALDLSEPQHR